MLKWKMNFQKGRSHSPRLIKVTLNPSQKHRLSASSRFGIAHTQHTHILAYTSLDRHSDMTRSISDALSVYVSRKHIDCACI